MQIRPRPFQALFVRRWNQTPLLVAPVKESLPLDAKLKRVLRPLYGQLICLVLPSTHCDFPFQASTTSFHSKGGRCPTLPGSRHR